MLNEIRQFGLEHAGRCDLTWIGREQFRGRSEKLGAISGKIVLRDDQERPVELHYWPDDNSDGVVEGQLFIPLQWKHTACVYNSGSG